VTRHLDNFEGAFPLLLIGSVILVYAAILANQQMGSHSSHLPLWGLLGGVGAVIVGAGVYSTFLGPEPTAASKPSAEWRLVPAGGLEGRKVGPEVARRPTISEPVPIWWEGSSDGTAAEPTPAPPTPPRHVSSTAPTVARAAPRPAPGLPRAVPRSSTRYTYRQLLDEMSELEAMVYGTSGAAPRGPARNPPTPSRSAVVCIDCDRPLTAAASASPCRECGRGLCARCVASSKSEDGEIRCIDCRAHAA